MYRTKNVDGFCIVASDHHYTGLVKWLRDQKVPVNIIGRDNSEKLKEMYGDCFIAVEDLDYVVRLKEDRILIGKIKNIINEQGERYALLSMVGKRLDVEYRDYCHSDLKSLLEYYEQEFEIVDGQDIDREAGYVKIRSAEP